MNRKRFEDLTFTDDYMFCKVLTTDKQLCIEVLETILDRRIADIAYPNDQETITPDYEGKGVRLDVYVEDTAKTVYNLEMQVELHIHLPKRSRYYQGAIDFKLLDRGDTYENLNESFVIFICEKDYYKLDYPIYVFRNYCDQNRALEFGDATRKVVLNASGDLSKATPKLAAFLRYIKDGTVTDALTAGLQKKVEEIKHSEQGRREYMMWELKLRDEYQAGKKEGREEGLEQGETIGINKAIQVFMLHNQGSSIADIANTLNISTECVEDYLQRANFV